MRMFQGGVLLLFWEDDVGVNVSMLVTAASWHDLRVLWEEEAVVGLDSTMMFVL